MARDLKTSLYLQPNQTPWLLSNCACILGEITGMN